MELTLYHYKANVESTYDGNTVRVNIDLGLKTWIMDEPIRLFGINAPELKGPERPKGLKSRDRLRELINGKEIFLETIKDTKGKFGRLPERSREEDRVEGSPFGRFSVETLVVGNPSGGCKS